MLAYTADEAKQKMIQGAVLVAPYTDTSYLPALRKAGALIVEEGGITSHTAVMGLELGIPVIVGCQDALTTILDNELLTVDARRGRVYHGATLSL